MGVLLALAVVIFAAIAAWAWFNRYSLIERQAITYLDSIGVEGDLKIRSASGTKADIRDIRLAYEGEQFLSVERLEAEYQWRDLLNGVVERLVFTGLDATLTIDETGQIIDGWRPPSSGETSSLPPRGITVNRASLNVRTPYGNIPISGDASLSRSDRFNVKGQLGEMSVYRDGMILAAQGPIELSRDGGPISVTSSGLDLSFTHPAGTLRQTRVEAEGTYDVNDGSATGQLLFRGGTFTAEAGLEGRLNRVRMDGHWQNRKLTADLDTQIETVSLTDPDRRRTLARTLSLAGALSEVPVAQNFAPGLVAPLTDLLSGSAIDTALAVQVDREVRTLTLRQPMTLTASRTHATFEPVENIPLYAYRSGQGRYDIAAKATLSRPLPLTLDPLSVTIRSENGLSVDGVATASGRVTTRGNWRASTAAQRPARLGSLALNFDYNAPLDAPSELSLRGSADYDGDVPGGYVEGLTAGGTLFTQLQNGRTRVDYRPNRSVKFKRLETTSDWIIEDFQGAISPSTPLYTRAGPRASARIKTTLSDATLKAVRPETDAEPAAALDLQIAAANLSGDIGTREQNWDVDFSTLSLKSETFPVPGTDLSLPEGKLNIVLSPDGRTQFALQTPSSIVLTPAYAVRGMALDVAGTAEDYVLNFSGGRVRLIPQTPDATPLPVLPASGTLIFRDGQFTGRAQSALPRASEHPFDIDYTLIDGLGEAQITMRGLRFRPGGLQPQELAPALRGKIAQVDGAINADLTVRFGGDQAPTGSGTVEILDMSLGTAPGPVTGLSGRVELTSLFPIVTAPDQSLRIGTFDPGFPLQNGAIEYALVEEGVAISRARFPLGEGQVAFDPFTWLYGADENRVTLRVTGVEIGEFLKDIGDGRLSATGMLEGAIPVVVRGIDVRVEKGRLEVRDGGTIRYQGKQVSDAIPNEYASQALKALENFNYEALFAEIDGPLDGDIRVGLIFTGSNPDVLYNVPFQFNVTVEGELFNIARSLNPNGLQDRVIASVTSQAREN